MTQVPYTPCVAASFDDLFIDEQLVDEASGAAWIVENLEGWWTAAPSRVDTMETWGPDEPTNGPNIGGRATVAKMLAREFTLTLVAFNQAGPLGPQVFSAIRRMNALATLATEQPTFFYVEDPADGRVALVRMNGVMKTEIIGELGSVRFTIPLIAPNPEFT